MNENILQDFDNQDKLIATLVKLAGIDGEIVEEETAYIWELAQELGFSKERYELVLLHADELAEPSPDNELEKAVFLFHLLKLIMADNKIVNEELNFYFKLGHVLKLNPNKVEKVGATWFKFVKTNISVEAFLLFWNQLED